MSNKTNSVTDTTDDKVSKLSLVIAIFVSITLTIMVLEWQGLLQHTSAKDDYPVAEYRAVFIEKQENKQYRLSHKPSNQTAVCNGGYLFVTSDLNDGMQGLLVDYKNRGVRCLPGNIVNP
jgi:hypothetical protein